jgi:hypothetical protein
MSKCTLNDESMVTKNKKIGGGGGGGVIGKFFVKFVINIGKLLQ